MASGAWHYREAERLLGATFGGNVTMAQAQVHATLALAAATDPDLNPDPERLASRGLKAGRWKTEDGRKVWEDES